MNFLIPENYASLRAHLSSLPMGKFGGIMVYLLGDDSSSWESKCEYSTHDQLL